MADVNINKFRASVVRDGSKPASPGFIVSEGQDPVDPAGNGQNHLPVTIATAATGLSITDSQVLGGAGNVGQYIRGDGSLADFPQASGGGSSVSYYLNGSISQGTIGGVAYKELNKVPILGAGTDFTINADGYIASFLTDAGDPNLLEIPGGNWNFETYFSASSSGGSPSFYVELYKYDGTTFTLIASSSSSPELIAFGTNLNPYFSTLAVPTTTLALTDRLAIRYYVTHSGRTITLHTENNHLCQVVTTFTTGLTSLNGLTAQVQNLAVGTSGTDFNIASATATHTFNLPTASATNRGALSSADWTTFNNKQNALTNPVTGTGTSGQVAYFNGTSAITGESGLVWDATNNYLSIGGATANSNLTVSGSDNTDIFTVLAGPNSRLHVGTVTSGTNVYVRSQNNYTLNLGVNNTNYLSIFNSGNIFIGTSASDAGFKLDVNGTGRFTNTLTPIILRSTNASTMWTEYYYNTSTLSGYIGSGSGLLSGANASDFIVRGEADFVVATGGNNRRLTIASTGEATFTSSVQTSTFFRSNTPTTNSITIGVSANANYNYIGNSNFWGIRTGTSADFNIDLNNSGSPINALRIASTGAATFSSSVTSNANEGLIISPSSGASYMNYRIGGTSYSLIGVAGTTSDIIAGSALGDLNIRATNSQKILFSTNNGGSAALTIASTGAATFSSTLRATEITAAMPSGNGALYINNSSLSNKNWTFIPQTSSSETDLLLFYTGSGAGTRMTITSGGNVGIGINNPSRKFQVMEAGTSTSGDVAAFRNDNSTSGAFINFIAGGTNAPAIGAKGNDIVFTADGYSGSERMRITSGGNVLIGTTTDSGAKFRVFGSGVSANIYSDNNTYCLGLGYQGTLHGYVGGISSALYALSINGGQVFLNSSSVWAAVSDVKRKRNFEDYNLGLDSILGLKPKLYNMDFQKDGDQKQVGLVAQEVKNFIPLAYEQNDKFIGLNYNAIIVTMVKAIQELKQEIDTLKN
jgi:hypothetical protein